MAPAWFGIMGGVKQCLSLSTFPGQAFSLALIEWSATVCRLMSLNKLLLK